MALGARISAGAMAYLQLGVLLIFTSVPALAAPPCQLTAEDYNALANADPPLSREQVDKLQGEDAERLCETRHLVRLSKTTRDFTCYLGPSQFWKYVSKEELSRDSFKKAIGEIMGSIVRDCPERRR